MFVLNGLNLEKTFRYNEMSVLSGCPWAAFDCSAHPHLYNQDFNHFYFAFRDWDCDVASLKLMKMRKFNSSLLNKKQDTKSMNIGNDDTDEKEIISEKK